MAGNALIDTGAILAPLDRNDRWHHPCVKAFTELRFLSSPSEAVFTELFHLIGDSEYEVRAGWKFVRSGALTIMPIADTDLPALDVLMHRYRNRPIDFADATLVHLAEQESLSRILTIDHDDFEPYRIKGRPVSGLCLPPTANDGDEFRSAPRRTAENKFTNAPALPIKHAFAR